MVYQPPLLLLSDMLCASRFLPIQLSRILLLPGDGNVCDFFCPPLLLRRGRERGEEKRHFPYLYKTLPATIHQFVHVYTQQRKPDPFMGPLHLAHVCVCASTHCPSIVLVLEESLSSSLTITLSSSGKKGMNPRARGVAESASGGGKVSLGQYVSLGLSLSLSGKDFGGRKRRWIDQIEKEERWRWG